MNFHDCRRIALQFCGFGKQNSLNPGAIQSLKKNRN